MDNKSEGTDNKALENLIKSAEKQQASYDKKKKEQPTPDEEPDSCDLDDGFCDSCGA